jgi:hypothetical protein
MYYGKPRPKTPDEFVGMWKKQAKEEFEEFISRESQSNYREMIPVEDYSDEQLAQIENLIRTVIQSSFVSVLAGLDGVTVGGVYQKYTVFDEEGSQLIPSEDFTAAWHQWSVECS